MRKQIERCRALARLSHLPRPPAMTPHEKAVTTINARLERLQANLRATNLESAQRFLLQSIVALIGVAEALNDYIKMVGRYAERRHGELKQANEALGARHADLLNSGKEFLEKLKADPTDRAIRKEIERLQQEMAAVQKTLRRAANTLQRDLAPGLAMIDQMAVSARRLSEAEEGEVLNRLLKTVIGQVRDFYSSHPAGPDVAGADIAAWEQSALADIGEAVDFYDAFARVGYQVTLALELMTMALSDNPSRTAEEATNRGHLAVAMRIKEITARFAAGPADSN